MKHLYFSKLSDVTKSVIHRLDANDVFSADALKDALCDSDALNELLSDCTQAEIEQAYQELDNLEPLKLNKNEFLKLSNKDQVDYINDISRYYSNCDVIEVKGEYQDLFYDVDDPENEIIDLYDYALDLDTWGDFSGQVFKY